MIRNVVRTVWRRSELIYTMQKPLTINLECEQQSLPSTFLKAKPSLSLKNSVPLVNCLILNELLCSLEVISKKNTHNISGKVVQSHRIPKLHEPGQSNINKQKLALSTWHRQVSYSLRIIAQDGFLAADESCSQTLACQPSYVTDETKPLVESICKTVPTSLFWIPTCIPGLEYAQ